MLFARAARSLPCARAPARLVLARRLSTATMPKGAADASPNEALSHLDDGTLSAHWMLTIQLWDQEAIATGVHKFLTANGCKKVLDASGGSGDCVLHLANLGGLELAFNDASEDMVSLARARLAEAGHTDVPLHAEFWSDMPGRVVGEGTYDCVMIRGNSLPYVASWDEATATLDAAQGRAALVDSLRGAFAMVRPGGLLLVDKSPNDRHGCFPVSNSGVVDGKRVNFCWTFVNDKPSLTREWHQFNQIDDTVHRKVCRSLMITDELLLGCLDEAGFVEPRHVELEHETTYKPFVARRP